MLYYFFGDRCSKNEKKKKIALQEPKVSLHVSYSYPSLLTAHPANSILFMEYLTPSSWYAVYYCSSIQFFLENLSSFLVF